MVITKFILIPGTLYSQVYTIGLGGFNPNSSQGYLTIGLLLFVIYVAIFLTAYRHYEKKVAAFLAGKKAAANAGAYKGTGMVAILVILGIIILASSGAGAVLLLPMLSSVNL
jgi:uncharacterized membrane protein